MPHNESLEPKRHAYRKLFGQVPLTHIKDYKNSIKVDLIKYDDREKMLKGTFDFVKATWSEDGRESERASEEEMQEALGQMLGGKTLQLGLETVGFIFRISGITRIDTHQIVRQRIGVTFSQQCTGDRFLTHNDVLMEESVYADKASRDAYIAATLSAKQAYAIMNDHGVSIQAARAINPHNYETFIFMKIDLSTLLFFYQKRIDDGSQTWQINEIARQMAEQVCNVYPEMKPVFEKYSKKFTFQRDASVDRKNMFSTSLYIPKVDDFDYHKRDFLYSDTKEALHFLGQPVPDMYFWGYVQVTEEQFNFIKDKYDEFDKLVHDNDWSNEEITIKARELNATIEATIPSGN